MHLAFSPRKLYTEIQKMHQLNKYVGIGECSRMIVTLVNIILRYEILR